ncbi:MAG: ATP-binding protein, partial [Anaerolineaceae bacterium]|nr:ATP-binding protein [Anaerolineaceae bacterium]
MKNKMQPYVGPRSFERKDQAIFFGRDKEARDLLSLIIANNVVLVYSPSGAGKTSLINAKLIPLLKKEDFEVLPLARVRSMTTPQINPEKIPNIYIFNSLMKWFEGKYEVERLAKMSMVDFLNERDHKRDNDGLLLPRAIIFDQFEELFTWHLDRWKDRAGFFEQVSRTLEKDSLLRIVFVMREDHIAKLDPYVHLLPNTFIHFHIDRMRKDAALLAVKGPLNMTDKSFAEGVAEKLVENLLKIRIETRPGDTVWVPGEFVEALQLQVVCQSVWQKLAEKEKQITLDHIEKDGNIDQALSKFYEDTIQEAKIYVDEERIRRWFEDVLITSMRTRGTVYRGPQSTGGISNSVIDILEDMHLIRAEWRAGARWYELTHDRFIDPILASNNAFSLKIKGVTEIENTRVIANEYIIDAEHAWGLKNYNDSIQKYQ